MYFSNFKIFNEPVKFEARSKLDTYNPLAGQKNHEVEVMSI